MGELVIAVGLLGIIVVFVAALFARLLSSSTKGAQQTVGIMFAQRRLDAAQRDGPPYWGSAAKMIPDAQGDYRETTSGVEGVYLQDDQAKTSFYYRFEADLIQAKTMGDLYRLKVDVVWWPSDASVAGQARRSDSRIEMGRQSTTLSRVYYQQNIKQPSPSS